MNRTELKEMLADQYALEVSDRNAECLRQFYETNTAELPGYKGDDDDTTDEENAQALAWLQAREASKPKSEHSFF
jgi:hypothetical protein